MGGGTPFLVARKVKGEKKNGKWKHRNERKKKREKDKKGKKITTKKQ